MKETTLFMTVNPKKIVTAKKAVTKLGYKYNLYISYNYVWRTCNVPDAFPNLQKQVENIVKSLTNLNVIFA